MARFVVMVNKATGDSDTWLEIDRRICEHFGQPQVEDRSYLSWYKFVVEIGFGMDNLNLEEQLAKSTPGSGGHEVLTWLIKHYEMDVEEIIELENH